MPNHHLDFYVGHAAADQIKSSGWFIGQFVPGDLGLRRQTDVELKWGVHADGETRESPHATGVSTTICVLVKGALELTLAVEGRQHVVRLRQPGDYAIYGRNVVHGWRAIGETIVLTVRFPSVEVGPADLQEPAVP